MFRAMRMMAARRMRFDANGVVEVLGADHATHSVMKLWELISNTVGVDPANYASRLAEFRRRAGVLRLHRLARTIQKGLRVDETVETLTGRFSAAFGNVLARYGDPIPPVDLGAAMADVLNPASPFLGIACPAYPRLSAALGGFAAGDMIMVWARTKLGKSLFCLRTALSFAAAGVPVLYVDTEMTERIFALRASAMLSGVTPKDRFKPENQVAIKSMTEEWERIHPLISYQAASSWGPGDIVRAIRDFRRRLGMGNGVVVYDWFRLAAGATIPNQQQWQTLTILAQEIKKAAMECRLPVLAASQQNRGAIGVAVEGMIDGVEAFAGGADGISQFASCSCAIYPATPELVAGFGGDARWAGKPCPVTHVVAVGGNRMGDSRMLIPMMRGDDLAFREVNDPDVLSYVGAFSTAGQAPKPRTKPRLAKLPDVPGVAGKIAGGVQVA